MTETGLYWLIAVGLFALTGWTRWFFSSRTVKQLSDGIVSWQERADEAARLGAQQKQIAEDRLRLISDYEQERDTWQRIYRQSAIQAGNAQAWLSRELNRVLSAANVARKKLGEPPVEVNPQLKMAISTFSEQHPAENIEAARAALPPSLANQLQQSGESTKSKSPVA